MLILHGKSDFADVFKLRDLEMGTLLSWINLVHLVWSKGPYKWEGGRRAKEISRGYTICFEDDRRDPKLRNVVASKRWGAGDGTDSLIEPPEET